MAANTGLSTCNKCGKTMSGTEFYTYKDGRKTEMCKKCMTLHVDNFDPSTFLWILEKMDVPYIEEEWNVLRDRAYAKDPKKLNGMSVLGKYLSKMKLKQWKTYGWADTETLRQKKIEDAEKVLEARREFEQELKEKLENGEINEAQYKTLVSVETQHAEEPVIPPQGPNYGEYSGAPQFSIAQEDLPDPAAELTQEDKIYLAMKWGRSYQPYQWVELERKYNEMMASFDIQDSDTMGTLILICKTYLKMNEAIDIGDVSGYNTLARAYDSLRKSAKFTAAQNKDSNDADFDSVGSIVRFCEKEGGAIPEYKIEAPKDIIDTILRDNKEYLRTLIGNDSNLTQQIENYLKKRELFEEQKLERLKAKDAGIDNVELNDMDFIAFKNQMNEDLEADALLESGEEE